MFKWMISGHKSSKHKAKYNNTNNNNNNNNNNSLNNARNKPNPGVNSTNVQNNDETQKETTNTPTTEGVQTNGDHEQPLQPQPPQPPQPLQQPKQPQPPSVLHPQQILFRNERSNSLAIGSRETLDDSNEYTTLENLQTTSRTSLISFKEVAPPDYAHASLTESQDDLPPPLPHPRPPLPPPQSLPSGIGSQPNLHQCPPLQGLPPLPSQNHLANPPLQAPGTCTLPRRSVSRDDSSSRYRSPSNPPSTSRQPPPYSRHQPPEPFNKERRPCQPPPPPRIPNGSVLSRQQHQQLPSQPQPQPPPSIETQPQQPLQPQIQSQPQPEQQQSQQQRLLQQQQYHIDTSQFDNKSAEESSSSEGPFEGYKSASWSFRDADSGFESINPRSSELSGPRSFDATPQLNKPTYSFTNTVDVLLDPSTLPSKSTEDLLNASRVLIDPSSNSLRIGKRPCVQGSHYSQNENEVLSSDSVYPGELSVSGRYEQQFSDNQKQNSLRRGHEYMIGVNSHSNESRRENHIQKNNQELTTFKPPKDIIQRRFDNDQLVISKDKPNSRYVDNTIGDYPRKESRPNDRPNSKAHVSTHEAMYNQYYGNENELYICEEEDKRETYNGTKGFQPKKQEDYRYTDNKEWMGPREGNETRSVRIDVGRDRTATYPGGAETLRVRDYQTYSDRSRNDGKETQENKDEIEREEGRKGDGCTTVSSSSSPPSSSWMEWTQQLQAYVAWVNSQLRKRSDKQLITDLRRDFQNGVVFADLIEIIAGEKVAGIIRKAETSQLRKENLDRVLQFMTAKRIRMTHITSKEIAEGNLKSIMRVILALAAHYKPQSVREGSAAVGTRPEATSQVPQTKNQQTQNTKQQQVQTQQQQQQHCQQSQQTQSQLHRSFSKATMHDVGVGPDIPLPGADRTPSLIRRNLTNLDGSDEPSNIILRRQPSLTHTSRPPSPSVPVYENIPRRSGQNRWAYDSLRASHKFHWGSSSTTDPKHLQQQQQDIRPGTKPYTLDDTTEDPLSTSFNTASSRCTSLNTSMEYDGDVTRDSAPCTPKTSSNKPAALDFWQELQGNERPNSSGKLSSEENEADSPFRYHTIHRMSGRRKLPQIPGHSSPSSNNNSRGATPLGLNSSGPPSDLSQTTSLVEGDSSSANRGGTHDDSSREPEGRSQNSSPAASLVRGPVVEAWRELVGLEKSLDQFKDQMGGGKEQQTQGQIGSARDRVPISLRSPVECGGGGGLESSQLGLKSGERERGGDAAVFSGEGATPTTLRQEVLRHVVARRTLESEKADLTRHLAAKDSLICDMRKQLIQKEKSFHVQRTHFEEAIRNIQNGKPFRLLAGDSAGCRSMTSSQQHGGREELQLVREAICALRGNFRGTDPNQHTLDTLEQAISVLMERSSSSSSTMMMNGGGGGAGGGEFLNGGGNGGVKDKRASHAHCDSSTKVIYFTDRTVTPFMSNIAKPLGDVTLRDFKNLFDRPGCFRFHFKSHDPEYGLVKEEIMNDDDILPGVDGKIIAWVEEDIIE